MMTERVLCLALGAAAGIIGMIVVLSVYLGFWFEPMDYEEKSGWERSAT